MKRTGNESNLTDSQTCKIELHNREEVFHGGGECSSRPMTPTTTNQYIYHLCGTQGILSFLLLFARAGFIFRCTINGPWVRINHNSSILIRTLKSSIKPSTFSSTVCTVSSSGNWTSFLLAVRPCGGSVHPLKTGPHSLVTKAVVCLQVSDATILNSKKT